MEARHNMISRSHRRRGAVLVEAAFVIPILILMVFGMIELGLAIKDSLALNQITREVGRISAVGGIKNIASAVTEANILAGKYGLSNQVVATSNKTSLFPVNPGEQVVIYLSYPHTPIVWGSTITLKASIVMRRE